MLRLRVLLDAIHELFELASESCSPNLSPPFSLLGCPIEYKSYTLKVFYVTTFAKDKEVVQNPRKTNSDTRRNPTSFLGLIWNLRAVDAADVDSLVRAQVIEDVALEDVWNRHDGALTVSRIVVTGAFYGVVGLDNVDLTHDM